MFAQIAQWLDQLAHQPGHVYAKLVPVALLGTIAVIVIHFVLVLIRRPASTPHRPWWNLWEKLIYLVFLFCVVDLAITAFYSVLRWDAMEGWFLFVHMVGSGGLVALLPLLAITWAEANRFGSGKQDAQDQRSAQTGRDASAATSRFPWISKVAFWIILASGLVTVMTMLLSMLPLYGTDGLHALLDIHRYSGLLLVVATMFHLYGVVLGRLGLR